MRWRYYWQSWGRCEVEDDVEDDLDDDDYDAVAKVGENVEGEVDVKDELGFRRREG